MKLKIMDAKIRTGQKISIEAGKKTFISLMGVNGAGKSTLLSTLAGLLKPINGKIVLCEDNFERDIFKMNATDRAKIIAHLSTERSDTLSLSVRESVSLGRVPHTGWSGRLERADEKIVDDALKKFQLDSLSEKNASHLSDGEARRVALARVVAQDADILLLDEPLAHLDIPWQLRVVRILRELADSGKIVIASLHEFDHAVKNSDAIWLMHNGNFLTGAPGEILPTLKDVFYNTALEV